METLQEFYEKKVVPEMIEAFGYTSRMQVPKIVKVTINTGLGSAALDRKVIDVASGYLARIAGQCPVATKAKKSIAGFKLREGNLIGAKVTLRRKKMWDFVSRLVNFALVQIRDFRGLSRRSWDGQGNYTIGVRDQSIFVEVADSVISQAQPMGLGITIQTTAKTSEEGLKLLESLGFPFSPAPSKK